MNGPSSWGVKIIIVLFGLGGILTILIGVLMCGVGIYGFIAGLPIMLGGVASVAIAQIMEMLLAIERNTRPGRP